MEKNVGGYDRLLRFVLGPILVVVGTASLLGIFTIAAGTIGLAVAVVAVLVGLVFLVTATTQKCPLNNALGLNTFRPASESESGTDVDEHGSRPS